MEFRVYIAKQLCKERNWPDNVHYETVRKRIQNGKYIKVVFIWNGKDKTPKNAYLPYDVGNRIKRGLELAELETQGKLIINS